MPNAEGLVLFAFIVSRSAFRFRRFQPICSLIFPNLLSLFW
jgi:hypothetical protein